MDDFKALLRKSGFKATPQRLKILTFLAASRKPLSAHDVIARLGKRVDPVTVYRTFKTLSDKAIIRGVDMRHNHAHYELVAPKHHHHHFICTNCSFVEDIESCDSDVMQKFALKKAKKFASVRDHSFEFFGLCKKCA